MASIRLQDLRRRLYVKAKADKDWRFWGLYVHVAKPETLRDAYDLAKRNNGAPGIDGVTFEAIEVAGVDAFLAQLRDELVARTYRPLRNRRVEIPKDDGKKIRVLGIPAIRDRVVQGALKRRLREELAKLDLRLNEAKSRVVDLTQGEAFGFLGFTLRRLRSTRGRWWVQLAPALKKRTALLRKLQEVFRRWRSQPVRRVIAVINPILRGWVNYFRVGNAARCFSIVRSWVERKVRRHMMRARGRRGFGWKRWSRAWLHTKLGLFTDYRVEYWDRA